MKFVFQIVVGYNKCMVWAMDSKYNVYVRQAVFDDFPFGTEWIIVPGIRAVNLTISYVILHLFPSFLIKPNLSKFFSLVVLLFGR